MKFTIPLSLAAAVLCCAPGAAAAALSGGSYTVPVLAALSGGAAASGGAFSAGALSLGGPSYSLAPLAGGAFSLATGAAPAVVIVESDNATLGAARCYPVPFKPSLGHTSITFTGLTRQARVRIYTVSGELVRTLDKNGGGETLDWDLRNSRGQRVASGVYLYTVKSGSQTATGKLMVIW
jgi:hypothetical protein